MPSSREAGGDQFPCIFSFWRLSAFHGSWPPSFYSSKLCFHDQISFGLSCLLLLNKDPCDPILPTQINQDYLLISTSITHICRVPFAMYSDIYGHRCLGVSMDYSAYNTFPFCPYFLTPRYSSIWPKPPFLA